MKQWIKLSRGLNKGLAAGAAVMLLVGSCCFVGSAFAQEHGGGTTAVQAQGHEAAPLPAVAGWAFMAAALATAIGSIGAGMAVSSVGAAAMGAVAEKPELMGKSLIYVALAEGIAIYGLLISIIILSKI